MIKFLCKFFFWWRKKAPPVAAEVVVTRPENWAGVAAVDVGTKHLRAEPPVPCQDSALVRFGGGIRPCAFVADGAGSASLSHYGSQETVLRLSHIAAALDDIHIPMLDTRGNTPSEEECSAHARRFLLHTSETIKHLAEEKNKPYKEFRSTLLAVIVGGERIFWIKVGDGHIVKEKSGGKLEIVGPLGKGEFANVTGFVEHSIDKTVFSCGIFPAEGVSGLALMTDGAAEKLVSNDGKQIAKRISTFLDKMRNETFDNKELHDFLSDKEVYNPASGYTGDDKGMALLSRKERQETPKQA